MSENVYQLGPAYVGLATLAHAFREPGRASAEWLPRSREAVTDVGLEEAADVRSFMADGWRFAAAPEDGPIAPDGPDRLDKAPLRATLMAWPHGGLVLVLPRMIVRMDPAFVPGDLGVAEFTESRPLDGVPGLYEVAVQSGDALLPEALERVLATLADDSRVAFAEAAIVERFDGRRTGSIIYQRQWQWPAIDVERVWNAGNEGQGAVIGIVDLGFHPRHEELRDNLREDRCAWIGPRGFVDRGTKHLPKGSHGTFCAALAAASRHDGVGGAGAAPRAGLAVVATRIGGADSNNVEHARLASAIRFAARSPQHGGAGADVISCSMGPERRSLTCSANLREAIDATTAGRNGLGTPVVWATFNDSSRIPTDSVCAHRRVLAVSAANQARQRQGSAYGPELSLIAPGIQVYGPYPHRYRAQDGASAAAPIVAGTIALALTAAPSISLAQIRRALRVGTGESKRTDDAGWGFLQSAATVDEAKKVAVGKPSQASGEAEPTAAPDLGRVDR